MPWMEASFAPPYLKQLYLDVINNKEQINMG